MIYASSDGVIRVKKEDTMIFNKTLKAVLKKENDARILIEKIKNLNDYKPKLAQFAKTRGRW